MTGTDTHCWLHSAVPPPPPARQAHGIPWPLDGIFKAARQGSRLVPSFSTPNFFCLLLEIAALNAQSIVLCGGLSPCKKGADASRKQTRNSQHSRSDHVFAFIQLWKLVRQPDVQARLSDPYQDSYHSISPPPPPPPPESHRYPSMASHAPFLIYPTRYWKKSLYTPPQMICHWYPGDFNYWPAAYS